MAQDNGDNQVYFSQVILTYNSCEQTRSLKPNETTFKQRAQKQSNAFPFSHKFMRFIEINWTSEHRFVRQACWLQEKSKKHVWLIFYGPYNHCKDEALEKILLASALDDKWRENKFVLDWILQQPTSEIATDSCVIMAHKECTINCCS